MPDPCPYAFIERAHALADASGEVLRRYFRAHVPVEQKGDASPVTIADREAEKTLRAQIEAAYPDHGILGEEFPPVRPDAGLRWVLDPIDGTRAFIGGFPTFTTLIALCEGDVPILGVIDQPITGERWTGARGHPTRLGEQVVRTRKGRALEEALLSTTSPMLFSDEEMPRFQRVQRAVGDVIYGGDAYAYAQVASGCIDAVVESGLSAHDMMALRPVVEGAGGVMTDWSGNPVTLRSDGGVVACGDERIYKEIAAILNVQN